MDIQLSISPELKAKIEREASACGMSVQDFMRNSLERAVAQQPSEDPLFADNAVYRGDGPSDFASNHDDYLYGGAS